MPISFYQLTFSQAYSHYLNGDVTAKGLIGFYLKIYRIQVTDIWANPLAKEEIRKKLGVEKSTFYAALTKLHEETSAVNVA